ncbi:MAG: hypothetical protein PSX81_06780 [bacterium]|nr:hypothetical protein [bacterium]
MKKEFFFTCLLWLSSATLVSACNDSLPEFTPVKQKYIGFNSNLLLAQFVPFNQNKITATNASILLRRYNPKNRGFRAGFGLSLDGNNSDQVLFLSIESDRRKSLSTKWLYFQGFGAQLNIRSPGFNRFRSASFEDEYFFGIGWHFGVEYKINPIFSLSVESSLRLGFDLDNGGPSFKIDPPINIMAHFNLSN